MVACADETRLFALQIGASICQLFLCHTTLLILHAVLRVAGQLLA